MTQAQLASIADIDRTMISRIESGEDGSLGTFRALGRALGVDYRQLMPADDGTGDQAQ
jgi:transcriptional regulator with XRE-family HTH domain